MNATVKDMMTTEVVAVRRETTFNTSQGRKALMLSSDVSVA